MCAPFFSEMEQYLVVTAIPLSDPGAIADRIALAGGFAQHYVGDTAFYDVEEQWAPDASGGGYHPATSVIRKVTYGDGRFDFSCQAIVSGYVPAQTMTERNGMLRVQVNKNLEGQDAFLQSLSFAVFDEDMNEAGVL